MRVDKWFVGTTIAVLCISISGCQTFEAFSDHKPAQVKAEGLVNGYMAYNGFRSYNGKFLEAGLLSESNRWGKVASLDIWPIGGVGGSLTGAKIKLLPFEVGLGILGHNPEPQSYQKKEGPEEIWLLRSCSVRSDLG